MDIPAFTAHQEGQVYLVRLNAVQNIRSEDYSNSMPTDPSCKHHYLQIGSKV